MEQYFFSPNRIVCFAEIKECRQGAFHQALLETIFAYVDYSSNLIFTALSFKKTGLESTEHVVDFGTLVETVGKNTFQKFGDT